MGSPSFEGERFLADRLFGKLAVQQNLCTCGEVDECLEILRRLIAEGSQSLPTLGELLASKGYLKARRGLEPELPQGRRQAPAGVDSIPEEVSQAAEDPACRVGKYVLGPVLGVGGMAEVRKAWDRELRRWVALKILKQASPEEAARFEREARTAAGLKHPNIGAVYEVGEVAGHAFIAMQFVDGETLVTFPRDDRKLLARIVRDAALAVEAAHDQGVIHRDLKPANIMVERNGAGAPRVFVLDFGMSKQTSVDSSLSVTGSVMGTPAYMSPEQARGSAKIDARSDVYSLGATMYEILTGRAPFAGESFYEIIRKVAEEEVVPVRRLRSEVDRGLERVVMKCLEKDAGRRYRSAGELAEDFSRWLEGDAVSAGEPSVAYRARKWLHRRKAWTAAGLAVAAAAGAFWAYRWNLRKEAEGWVEEARGRAAAGEFEEAKKLLDQAATRIDADPELYLLCREQIEERRKALEEKQAEQRILGPARARLSQLSSTPEGWQSALEQLEEVVKQVPSSWEAWMLKADYHQKMRQWTDALEVYQSVLELNSRVVTARFRRGFLLHRLGRKEEALEEFRRGWESDPANEYSALARAQIAFDEGGAEEALALLDEAERSGVGVSELFRLRGKIRLEESRGKGCEYLPASIHDLRKARELDPSDPTILSMLGLAYHRRGDYSLALRSLDEALRMEPENPVDLERRGMTKYEMGNWEGAMRDFDEAVRLDESDPSCVRNRGNAKLMMKDWEGAREDFERALQMNPNDEHAYNGRGAVRALRGEVNLALQDYAKAIELRPGLYEAVKNRLLLYRETGDRAKALADADRLIALRPEDANSYVLRGDIFHERGDYGAAVADYGEAIRLAPDSSQTFLNRGIARHNSGDFHGAERDFTEALRLRAGWVPALYHRGLARGDGGKWKEAEEDFSAVVDRVPGDATAFYRRSLARAKLGDFAGQADDLKRALARAPEEWEHREEVERLLERTKATE